MPKPPKLHPELWDKSMLLTEPQYLVLKSLTEPERLLFVEDLSGGRYRSSVTNSIDAPGYSTKIASMELIRRGFLKKHDDWAERALPNVTTYKITAFGREAIVQYELHHVHLEELHQKMSQEIGQRLTELRKTHKIE